jgi:hypothetical protein
MSQSKKNFLLLISLATLSIASLILFLSGREVKSEIDPTLFKLPDSKAVDKVTIEKSKEKIELQFINGGWRVSRSGVEEVSSSNIAVAWEADRDLIDVLFATMEQVVPKRNVASRIQDSVVNQISKTGVKVSFVSNSTVQKSFAVLGHEAEGITYFLKDGEVTPYIMAIPGYRVYVAGIFEQAPNAWRDKRIFSFNWRNFKELKAEFPRTPDQSFTVAMTGRYFSIVGESKIDTTALNNYLDAVSLIRADEFYKVGESTKKDSLGSTNPIMVITVKDVADQIYALKLFTIEKNERNALALWEIRTAEPNSEARAAVPPSGVSRSGSDFVLFDRRNILQLYKMKKDFVQ